MKYQRGFIFNPIQVDKYTVVQEINFMNYFTFSRFETTISRGKNIFVGGAIVARNWVAYYFLSMHWKCFFDRYKKRPLNPFSSFSNVEVSRKLKMGLRPPKK